MLPWCVPMQIRTAGVFAEWDAFTGSDVQGFALLDTGASRTVGGYTMVQHVIDSMVLQQTLTWMESDELAVNFTFVESEQAQSATKMCVVPCQEQTQNSPSEATPNLFKLNMNPAVGLVIDASLTVLHHWTSASTPMTVKPSGHLVIYCCRRVCRHSHQNNLRSRRTRTSLNSTVAAFSG